MGEVDGTGRYNLEEGGMTGLLICAAVVAGFLGWLVAHAGGYHQRMDDGWLGLALIAVALWLAYAAGGA